MSEMGTGTNNHIYRLDRALNLLNTYNIATSNYELESVCYDPSDDNLWTLSDKLTLETLEHRSRSDPTTVLATINLAVLGVDGPQDIDYDTSDDTLWIADNDSTGNYVGRLYHLDKAGNILETIPIPTTLHSVLSGKVGRLQTVAYDSRDDTLWISGRFNYIYHVTKSLVLLESFASPYFGTGPTSIALVPWGTRAKVLSPTLSLRMYDDATNTQVAAQAGSDATLEGTGNTEDKSGVGPIKNAFTFNGTDNYISISETLTRATGWTVSCWASFASTISYEVFIGDGATGDNWIRLTDNTRVAASFNGYGQTATPGFSALSLNTWYHFVFIFASSNNRLRIFLDGVEYNPITGYGAIPDTLFTTVGRKQTDYFGGKMSNLLLFNYELDQDEIDYLYNEGAGEDALEESIPEVIRRQPLQELVGSPVIGAF